MAQLISVREGVHKGEEGFFHTYEVVGATEFTTEEKALGAAASRYPLKARKIEVTDSKQVATGPMQEWETTVFVPKKGLKENAREKARDLASSFRGE